MFEKKRSIWINALVFIVFVIFSVLSILKLNKIVLETSQIMGNEITARLADNENMYFEKYEIFLNNGAFKLQNLIEDHEGKKEIIAWIKEYENYMGNSLDLQTMEFFAYIDGKVFIVDQEKEKQLKEIENTSWYKNTLKAGGDCYYTNIYLDQGKKEPVITISKVVGNTKDIFAVNLYPKRIKNWISLKHVPKGTKYYLYDSNGFLIHVDGVAEDAEEETEVFAAKLFEEVKAGKHDLPTSSILGPNGLKKGVYYHVSDSGWYFVITIPYIELLGEIQPLNYIFMGMIVLYFIGLLILIISERYSNRKAVLYNQMTNILGDFYYGIYLIDIDKNTYSMIKGSEYMKTHLPSYGSYDNFSSAIGEIIEQKYYEEYLSNFSIERIRELVAQNVRDFEREFRFLFHEKFLWSQVQLLQDPSVVGDKIILCFKEVNEQKEQELVRKQLLEESLETVKNALQSKNMFFSSISHDMRTPLNAIIGLSDLAQHHIDDKKKIEDYMEKINVSSKQLLSLINDILDISKFEQETKEVSKSEFDLVEFVEETVSVFEVQAYNEKKHFTLHIDVKNCLVASDWAKLQRLLNNLLSNAMKFTKEDDSIDVYVKQLQYRSNLYAEYQFIVQDTGIGMSKEFLNRIFLPFEREINVNTSKVGGTGLGMPIVHSVVQQMNGQIQVESELSKGTKFVITIPIEVIEEKRIDFSDGETERKKKKQECKKSEYYVLLVEDNEFNMEISTEILKLHGFNVTQAWNGKEAVEKFKQSEEGFFDVILMDMQMPVMNGCQGTKEIRKLNRNDAKKIPIIALTANAFTEDIVETKEAGMNGHITKPIDMDVFEKTLREIMNEQ